MNASLMKKLKESLRGNVLNESAVLNFKWREYMVDDIVLLGIAAIVTLWAAYGYFKEEGLDLLTVFALTLGLLFGANGIKLGAVYYKVEHNSAYMKSVDYHERNSAKGVTEYIVTFYYNKVLLECSVSSGKYGKVEIGEKEYFYVDYIRDKDKYYCDGVR